MNIGCYQAERFQKNPGTSLNKQPKIRKISWAKINLCQNTQSGHFFFIHRDEATSHIFSVRLLSCLWFKVQCLAQTWALRQDAGLLSSLGTLAEQYLDPPSSVEHRQIQDLSRYWNTSSAKGFSRHLYKTNNSFCLVSFFLTYLRLGFCVYQPAVEYSPF